MNARLSTEDPQLPARPRRRPFADWAARYVERFGFALTPLKGKAPIAGKRWNEDAKLIRTVPQAVRYFTRHPNANLGACLQPSGLVSLDCDSLEHTRAVLAAEGIDVDALIREHPTIVGRAPRVMFKAPDGVALSHHPLRWPHQTKPREWICVLEMRAGRIQDVLPPSIHPDTHRPYRWENPPVAGFSELPAPLLALWQEFDAFAKRAARLCPWAQPDPEPRPIPKRNRSCPHTGPSVIAAFNAAHDAAAILTAHGYVREGRRYRAPGSETHAPGVLLCPDGRVRCYHWSDPLGDNKPHDAFDVYAQLAHDGDVRAAVRAAAELLGLGGRHA